MFSKVKDLNLGLPEPKVVVLLIILIRAAIRSDFKI